MDLTKLRAGWDDLLDVDKGQPINKELGYKFLKFDGKLQRQIMNLRLMPSKISDRPIEVVKEHNHFILNPNTGKQTLVPCLRVKNKDCPICDYVEELKKTPEGAHIAEKIQVNQRFVMWVYSIEQKCFCILGFASLGLAKGLKNTTEFLASKGIDPFSADKGSVVKIVKSGMGFDTRYEVSVAIERHELSVDDLEHFKTLPTLHEYLGNLTAEDYTKMLNGQRFEDTRNNTTYQKLPEKIEQNTPQTQPQTEIRVIATEVLPSTNIVLTQQIPQQLVGVMPHRTVNVQSTTAMSMDVDDILTRLDR